MDPVSNTSPFAILLRQRLAERGRLKAKGSVNRTTGKDPATPTGASAAISSLVSQKGLDDHETLRALIEQLLGTGFGDQLMNEAKFQQIVGQVTRAMEADPELAREMARVLRALS